MKKGLLPLLLLTLLGFSGCPRTDLGERLFIVDYPPFNFTVPAGGTSVQVPVVALSNLPTGFQTALTDNGLTAADVDLVGGFRARITSLDGSDFSEIERVELRACPVSQGGCDFFDLLFSAFDLAGRRQQVINLSPGERNVRELFLNQERMNVELVFTPLRTTTRSIEARLEWSVAAARAD